MCDLKNKDSLIYSELLKAIDKFNKGKLFRFVPKNILKTYELSYRRYLTLKLYTNKFYYDWESECLLALYRNQFFVIYITC